MDGSKDGCTCTGCMQAAFRVRMNVHHFLPKYNSCKQLLAALIVSQYYKFHPTILHNICSITVLMWVTN